MNILIISPSTYGTIAGLSFNLYRAFVASGQVNTFLICLDGSQNDLPPDIDSVIVVEKKQGRWWHQLGNAIRRIYAIRTMVRDKSINISISTLLGCTLWNVMSLTKEDRKVGIFHTRPDQSKYLGLKKFLLFSLAYRMVMPRLDVVVAVNQTAKDAIEDKYKVNTNLIYNIHDFKRINSLASEPITEQDIFNRQTFLYVGHLTEIKAPERLLKAFAQMNASKQFSLCFIGEGYLEPKLKELVKDYDLEDCVVFLGFQRNPYKYIAKCKCLMLVSQDEGLPGVLIEALSLGKRVITTNSSKGVWEILQCSEDYDPNLAYRYCNDLGVIVPNYYDTQERDNITINELAQAMLDEVMREDEAVIDGFDKSRFSASYVVSQYMKLFK